MKLLHLLFAAGILLAFTSGKNDEKDTPELNYTVIIDFGERQDSIQSEVVSSRELTALEALMRVATVETHPVSAYVFVSSINQVKGERGKTAWYYTVNGTSAKVLAIDNTLQAGDTLRWVYKKDVCSAKVDGICGATK